jgi:hypothetical protein
MNEVGSGVIQGGWAYVIAAYLVVYVTLAGYALSLYRRRQKDRGDQA